MLTATADNKTREYGDANPTFTISYSGFKNDDDASKIDTPVTGSTIATRTTPVGTVPITTVAGADNNYDFDYTPGELTITKAGLVIKADDKTKTYGDPNPPFTFSYDGFKNDETDAVLTSLPTATSTATTSDDDDDDNETLEK